MLLGGTVGIVTAWATGECDGFLEARLAEDDPDAVGDAVVGERDRRAVVRQRLAVELGRDDTPRLTPCGFSTTIS